jgi:MraZ protein
VVGEAVALLIGEYFHSLDSKLRLTLPAKLRAAINPEEEGPGFYVVLEFDGVLSLFTPKRYRETYPIPAANAQVKQGEKNCRRVRSGTTETAELDRLGRMVMSESALKRCEIKKDVAIVGVQDHIEIWDRTKWETFVLAEMRRQREKAERELQAEAQGQGTPPPTPNQG